MDETKPVRVVVLLSGTGSLFAALADAAAQPGYPVRVVAVVSDNPGAGGLELARQRGIATAVVRLADFPSREAWDAGLSEAVAAFHPDLVVSAGFMKVVGPAFLRRFEGRTLNTHPALLPHFPGAHAVRDALAAGAQVTGCSVHWVDAGVDTGQVVAQREVAVMPGDDEASLHERIKQRERALLIEVLSSPAALLAASGRAPGAGQPNRPAPGGRPSASPVE